MKKLCALLCAGLGLSMLAVGAQADVKVGDDAPDFEMVGSDGKTYKLSDFKDKQAVVVAWYPKAFTGGCTAECKSLRESGETLRKFNVAYFTASCDSVKKNTDFAKSLDLDYPILSDPTGEVATAYGIYNGKVARRKTFYIGIDGKILHIAAPASTKVHGQEIAKQLGELGVSKK